MNNSLAQKIGLADLRGKTYKIFLVEEDDEDREQVIAGRVSMVETEIDIDYSDIEVDQLLDAAVIFKSSEKVTLSMRLLKNDDGTYFNVENFDDEEDDEIEYGDQNDWEVYVGAQRY